MGPDPSWDGTVAAVAGGPMADMAAAVEADLVAAAGDMEGVMVAGVVAGVVVAVEEGAVAGAEGTDSLKADDCRTLRCAAFEQGRCAESGMDMECLPPFPGGYYPKKPTCGGPYMFPPIHRAANSNDTGGSQ